MYVKTSVRKTKNGEVRYLQLAHNEWDAASRRSVPKIVYSLGREDQLDKDAVRRLVASLSRLLEPAGALAAVRRGVRARPAVGPAGDQQDPGRARLVRPGPAARRRRGGAGAVRADRQPGAGPVLETGGGGVDEPRRAHRRARRCQRRRVLPGNALAAPSARRAGEAGVPRSCRPAEPRGGPAFLRHHAGVLRAGGRRRGDRPDLAGREAGRWRGRGPG